MVGSKLGSTWLGAEGRCPSSWFPHLVGCELLQVLVLPHLRAASEDFTSTRRHRHLSLEKGLVAPATEATEKIHSLLQ